VENAAQVNIVRSTVPPSGDVYGPQTTRFRRIPLIYAKALCGDPSQLSLVPPDASRTRSSTTTRRSPCTRRTTLAGAGFLDWKSPARPTCGPAESSNSTPTHPSSSRHDERAGAGATRAFGVSNDLPACQQRRRFGRTAGHGVGRGHTRRRRLVQSGTAPARAGTLTSTSTYDIQSASVQRQYRRLGRTGQSDRRHAARRPFTLHRRQTVSTGFC